MSSNGKAAAFNLCDDPWIPCVTTKGEALDLSLKGFFEKAEALSDFSATPPQRVALMRLLIAITMRALEGPKDDADWKSCRPRIKQAALAYLERMRDRFELYGPKAFLQVPSLGGPLNANLDKLDFSLASGNNHTLFDHGATPEGRESPPASQALSLVTFQMFSTGGLIGQVKWNGVVTSKSAEQAPCSEGVPLHCFLQGGDLLQTLHLNLIPFQVLGVENLGVPLWELDSIKASAAADGTFFGRMAPMARAMALEPSGNKLKLANGLKYAKLPEFIDPFLTRIKTSKDLPAYLRIDLAKHPWRELQAVLALARRGAGSPEQLRHLLDLPPDTIVRLWTGGMEIDQAKILGFGEWSFVFPAALAQGDSIMKAYSDGVECASLAISLLKDAFKKMNNENKVKIVPSFAKEQAVASFWHGLDALHDELAAQSAKQDIGEWRRTVKAKALAAFDEVCPSGTPRQIVAAVQARGYLAAALQKCVVENERPKDKKSKKGKQTEEEAQ